jgi:moderate conductance mechanosensitive channel
MRSPDLTFGPTLAQDAVATVCEDSGFLCHFVYDRTGSESLAEFIETVVGVPLRIAFILILAYVANRLVRRGIRRMVARMQEEGTAERIGKFRRRTGLALLETTAAPSIRRAQRAESIGALLRSVSTVVIWTIAIITSLGELGISLGPIIAGAGIVGVAVGFGAQNLVRDFLSGVFMLIEDQFGVGDIIDAGEATGTVEGISLRTTRIRDVGGTVWHVPNGVITRVGNMSQEWSRALLDIEVAYGTDIDHAIVIIGRCAHAFAEDPEWGRVVLEEPEVWGVEQLAESGITIRLVVKTKPLEQFKAMRELRRRIKAAFDAEGIEIPFPQRTIWVRREGELPKEQRPESSASEADRYIDEDQREFPEPEEPPVEDEAADESGEAGTRTDREPPPMTGTQALPMDETDEGAADEDDTSGSAHQREPRRDDEGWGPEATGYWSDEDR